MNLKSLWDNTAFRIIAPLALGTAFLGGVMAFSGWELWKISQDVKAQQAQPGSAPPSAAPAP